MVQYRDPAASLSCEPVTFELIGKTYEIPALPAATWVGLLYRENLSMLDIVPGLLEPEDQDEINLALIRGDIDTKEISTVAEDVLSVTSGRDWWVTVRIAAVAKASWDGIGGEISKLGNNWLSLPLGAWLDVAWLVMRKSVFESGDPKTATTRLTQFVNDIERSPVNPNEELDEEAEAEAFMRAMQMAG